MDGAREGKKDGKNGGEGGREEWWGARGRRGAERRRQLRNSSIQRPLRTLPLQTLMKGLNCIISVPPFRGRTQEETNLPLEFGEDEKQTTSAAAAAALCLGFRRTHTPRTRPHKTPQDGRPPPGPRAGHMLASQACSRGPYCLSRPQSEARPRGAIYVVKWPIQGEFLWSKKTR